MAEPQASTELSCERCRDLLSDYVDRELSEHERSAVERHLGSCNKCGTESTRLMGLKNIMQHWNGVKGSGEFRATVMQRMIRESQQSPSQQFTNAAAAARSPASSPVDADGEADVHALPPIWILLAASALAVAAYYLVLWLRGI